MSGPPAWVIAIDGPSGSGKTTLARALAGRLGLSHLDTGAMYRAVAFAAIRAGVDLTDTREVAAVAQRSHIDVGDAVVVDGLDATQEIRSEEVTRAASIVAANPDVRRELVARQRAWVEHHGPSVVEGRDIGTVVFPEARMKLYLVARAEERARRRAAELGNLDEKSTRQALADRDRRDSTRILSPLVQAVDAREVDTTHRSVESIVEEVVTALGADGHDFGNEGARDVDGHARGAGPPARDVTKLEGRVTGQASAPSRGALAFYAICRLIAVGVCRVYCRVTVEGRENLPKSGAYVLAPVHRSYVDWIVIGCITRTRLRFMAKDTLWKSRFTGRLLFALGTFPVHRGSADRGALKECIAVLAEGEPLVMFPEGTRMSGPVVNELFDGAAYVAARAGVPVVPVGIGGSELVMQKGKALPRPRKIHIVVGTPIRVGPSSGRVPRRAVAEATEILHDRVQALFDAAQIRALRQATPR